MSLLKKLMTDHLLNWQDLYYFRHDIENIHIAEKQLIENTEKFSKELEEKFDQEKANDEILQKIKGNSDSYEEAYAGYYDHRYERKELIIGTVIQSHRKSSVLSIYALLESHLKILIEVAQGRFKFKLNLSDLNGADDLYQIWIYFEKVFEIDMTSLEPLFTPLKQQKYVRNKITHNGSKIDKKKITFINELPGLKVHSFGEDHYLKIEDERYALNLLEVSSKFFKQLILEMDKKYLELVKAGW